MTTQFKDPTTGDMKLFVDFSDHSSFHLKYNMELWPRILKPDAIGAPPPGLVSCDNVQGSFNSVKTGGTALTTVSNSPADGDVGDTPVNVGHGRPTRPRAQQRTVLAVNSRYETEQPQSGSISETRFDLNQDLPGYLVGGFAFRDQQVSVGGVHPDSDGGGTSSGESGDDLEV